MVINVASIEISILCIVILLMILATYKGNFQQKPQSGLFKLVIYCFVVFSVVDASSLIISPKAFQLQRTLNFLKLVSCSGIGLSWFLFIYSITDHSIYKLRKWSPLVATPFFAIVVISAIDLILHFNDSQIQLNNSVWIAFNAALVVYNIAASALAHVSAQKSRNKFLRRQYRYLTVIMFVPLAAMAIQAQFIDIMISPPIFALTLLHLYIKTIKRQITLDQSTGINNIHKLAEHLTAITSRQSSDKRVFYMQIKVDRAKHIKKKFGLEKYTEIICMLAKYLEEQCHLKDVFLARADFDSFAIVFEAENQNDIETFGNNITRNFSLNEKQNIIPWEISFSIYWSEYGTEENPTIDSLLDNKTSNCLKSPS